MNKFIGIGRLTKDVELRTTESGKTCGTFTLAINRRFKNIDGNYDTDFFNCVIWNNSETLTKYAKKGDMLAVEGRIQNRSYDTHDGTKRYITEVIVESFDFIATKKTTEDKFEKVEDTTNPFEEFGEQVVMADEEELPFE